MLTRQAQAEQNGVQAPPQVEQQTETPRPGGDAGGAAPDSPPAAAARSAAPLPSPLAESTRRFLKPLVSIDPAGVRVHRGVQADALTSSFGADAITIGDDVALSAGHAADTPETLGLLAHELTHVARRHEPRFVPPVARGLQGPAVPRPTSPAESRRSSPQPAVELGSLPVPGGEEGLARRVEAETTALAQTRDVTPARPAIEPARAPSTPDPASTGDGQVTFRRQAAGPIPVGREKRSPRSDWDGLPAPWEPLPAWLTAPSRGTEAPALAAPAPPSPQTVIQRAEHGRTLEKESEDLEFRPSETDHAAVEPDLDALARRVYTIVKRRLELERRRSR